MLVSAPPGEAYSLRLGRRPPFRPEECPIVGEFMPLRPVLAVALPVGIGERGVLLLAIAGERQGPSELGAAPPFAWLSLATELGVDERLALFALVRLEALLMQEVPPKGTLLAFEIIFGTKT